MCGQCHCSRRDGTDGDGNGGDCPVVWCRETKPDLFLASGCPCCAKLQNDSNRTIQIALILEFNPGSGVGNYRNAMTEGSMGVPVIGIGVPTVVDAATIVNDTMENFIHALETSEALKGVQERLCALIISGGKV